LGQVALTPVAVVDHQSSADRDFVSMSTVGVEYVDVPMDVDVAGIDPTEIYEDLEIPFPAQARNA